MNSNSGWVDVFWSPVAVSLSTTYYMVLESTNDIVAAFSDSDTYSNGNALYAGNTTTFSHFDLAFRTYYDDGVQIQVPEPGTLALFSLGLVGLGLVRHVARPSHSHRAYESAAYGRRFSL